MTPAFRSPSGAPADRRPGRMAAVTAGLLVLLLGLVACSSALGGESVGDPTPVTAGGVVPTGRTDPATQPALARFYGQRIAWEGCGGGFECGKVTVPVDWAHPDAATLQLAVLRRPATGQRLGSLLINPGGPGVAGATWVREAAGSFGSALRAAYDLV
ncbi:MAG: alpha/beta hydrolase, partial [Kineosporiaceae bacterium]